MSQRSARTRTLIQLGGLLSKTNFLKFFDISLGDDLQLEDENNEKALILTGLLQDLCEQLPSHLTDQQKEALKEKGIIALARK